MTALKTAAILAALSFGACGEPATNAGAPEEPVAAPSTPSPTPEPAPADMKTIPATFRGVWAATEDDCVKPAETRMEIGAGQLQLYESSGSIASVEATGPDEIHIVVLLSGEGATSQRSFRYRLIEGGAALFDVRNGLVRRRCPGLVH